MRTTSYHGLSQFAQQQSRASAFVLSIDNEEFSHDGAAAPALDSIRSFIGEVRRRNAEVPIYLYGETTSARHLPNDILRAPQASSTCSRTRRSSSRAA